MSLRKSMLNYMERTGKTGFYAILATYRAYQNHLNYEFFYEQMAKVGIAIPKELESLEYACQPKTETVTKLVAGYISRRAAFEWNDLKEYLIMKRDYIDDGHLTRTIKIFTESGAIERVGKGAYLSNVAA